MDGDKILINKFDKNFKKNDILIFSKFNDTFIKRCVALPGDTVQLINGDVYINNKLIAFSGSVINSPQPSSPDDFNIFIFNYYKQKWTERNFGPYIVPKKNLEITLDDKLLKVFKEIIIEESKNINLQKLMGKRYQFKNSYYFMLGDNRLRSKDSRMFGPISEHAIIGKARYLLYSKNNLSRINILSTIQ